MAQLFNAAVLGASATVQASKPNDAKSTFALIMVNASVASDVGVDVSDDGTNFFPLMAGGVNQGTLEESRPITAVAGPVAFVLNVAGARYVRVRIINTTAGAGTVTAYLDYSPNRV